MFSESHTCEIPHICWPLEVDITHNRESKAPNALIHWSGARLLLRRRKTLCTASAQPARPYLFSSISLVAVGFFPLFPFAQCVFVIFPFRHSSSSHQAVLRHPGHGTAVLSASVNISCTTLRLLKMFYPMGIFWTRALKTINSSYAV